MSAPSIRQPGFLVENLLRFSRALRGAGVAVSPEQGRSLVAALRWIDLGSRDQVFYAARSLLVTRREDLCLFETLFNRFFGSLSPAGSGSGVGERGSPQPILRRHRRLGISSLMAARAAASDPELEIADRSATWSPTEVLQVKPFAAMSDEELEAVQRLMQGMRWRLAERRTRRKTRGRAGTPDLRRALRDAGKHDGRLLRLFWRSPKLKQRPLVLIADISGSMERYARLVLQLFFGIFQRLSGVEAFVFGTRLSRITPQLRLRNVDRALAEAAARIVDWGGGTRIGDSLQSFNRHWSRRVLRRGAVVLIVSDGWERGEVELLRREMRFLQRRSYRLVWLNPLLGRPAYEPRVEGMAAALPYVDDFLPIHDLRSLEELARHLAAIPGRRGARRHGEPITREERLP